MDTGKLCWTELYDNEYTQRHEVVADADTLIIIYHSLKHRRDFTAFEYYGPQAEFMQKLIH